MSTLQQKVNELPTGLPQPNDYMTFHDAAGTCKRAQWSDIQENTPPPIDWQNRILEDVKIAYNNSGFIYLDPLTEVNQHLNDFIGLGLPQCGLIVYPEVITLPWGTNTKKCVAASTGQYVDALTSGKAETLEAYNSDDANKGLGTAIGYARNFSRAVGGKGIGQGDWYLPHPSECMLILSQYNAQLQYAASLFGYTWPSYLWTCRDRSAESADLFVCNKCNVQSSPKSNANGVMLLAKMPLKLKNV